MSVARSPRWLMSFADLCLLLLGFFVLLHARADGTAAAASVRAAFGGAARSGDTVALAADALFDPNEAVLRPRATARLAAFGRRMAARHARVRVASTGSVAGTARFDGWELSAARAAAVARAVAGGGIAAQRIEIALPQAPAAMAGPQRFTLGPA